MTEKENRVKQCEVDVGLAEVKLKEARSNLEHGYAKAKAELEQAYATLKMDVERAELEVERERAHLEEARAELARGFEA